MDFGEIDHQRVINLPLNKKSKIHPISTKPTLPDLRILPIQNN